MSIWDEARMGGRLGKRHSLGLWDPRYKLASLAWLPPLSERKKIYGKRRFVFVFNFALTANAPTAYDRISLTQDFWWTDTIFSSTTTAPVSAVSLYDTQNQVRYMNIAELTDLMASHSALGILNMNPPIANVPYFERRITRIPAGAALLMTLQASSPFPSTIFPITQQVCLGGYTE